MSNPQDHPITPPPPFSSNSSSSTPPSVSPKPRFRRQKMLARKTVASGDLRKVLNERLKASQVKESPALKSHSSFESEYFQSATERDRDGSSDSEKTQESPSEVSSSVVENLETRFVLVGPIRDVELPEMSRSGDESGMKSRGSGSGEAAEGLVGASYDPKKRKATTPKAPNVPKPSKKRKASSPTPTASSMPRGRATRRRVKQSETDLQKALEESKKRKKDKGKEKVGESSEAVEEEEMELVHQERGTIVEVCTPKPKKPKTSSKKSSSVPVAAEPTLAKRTRSAVKAKQTKVSDDDD
uniref:Proteoglycan 4-like n=1 Tax=Nicotiana tabacum TaxID=4097 RepID=A0A1S3YVP1_TOBAC|nr:PREDICTED: proteoglycan 4-like [Nicotiana tabacum]